MVPLLLANPSAGLGARKRHESVSDRHFRHCGDPRASPGCFRATSAESSCASSARPSRCRPASRSSCCTHAAGARRRCTALSNGVSALLGYAGAGTNFMFGPLAKPELGGAELRHRRAAGDHLLRGPRLDPLLSRHHAVHHPLGRRRDREGDGDHQGRVPVRGGEHLRRPERERRWSIRPYLARPDALAALRGDDRRHGGRRGHDPRGLCQPARAAGICPICSRHRSWRRRAAC